LAWQENKKLIGHKVELLVALGEGRKDAATHRMSGRARDGRLVHFAPTGPMIEGAIRPGDVVETVVTYGATHHLVADGDLISHRRTKAGDNAEAGLRPQTKGIQSGSEIQGVTLGLPSFGAPAAQPVANTGCGA
jgi:tRNA-2-methylthio-N6-dimethylallyladenosine synthase